MSVPRQRRVPKQRTPNEHSTLNARHTTPVASPLKTVHAPNPVGHAPKSKDAGPEGSEAEVRALLTPQVYVTPEFYYVGRGKYVVRNLEGNYVPITKEDAGVRLSRLDVEAKRVMGLMDAGVNQLEHIQDNYYAPFEGRLAGYPKGYYPTLFEKPILLTSEAQMLVPTRGSNTMIRDHYSKLLGPVQTPFYFDWLKTALEERVHGIRQLRRGVWPNWQPAQAVVFMGEPNDGKTFSVLQGVKMIAGQKSIKGAPASAYAGGTTFNQDTSEREFHALDDDFDDVDNKGKQRLREQIKKSVADPDTRVHKKGIDAMMFKLFRRTVICINSKNADVMPAMTGGAADKFIVFETKAAVAKSLGSREAWDARAATLLGDKAMSDFMGWLLWEHEIADERRNKTGRYGGVTSYKNPRALARINANTNAARMLELIEDKESWKQLSSKAWAPGRFIGYSSEVWDVVKCIEGQRFTATATGFGMVLSQASDVFSTRIHNWGRPNQARTFIYEIVPEGGRFLTPEKLHAAMQNRKRAGV
jgi:hypothetical protein